MNNTILSSIVIFFLVVVFPSCKKETGNPIESKISNLPEGVAGYVSIKYQHLATAPTYIQTTMLTGYNGKLYRIGSKWPIYVWDLKNNNWSQIPLPDSTYWRWDGAAITYGDSIFIIATYYNSFYDILVLDASTNSFHHTNVNLPVFFLRPAYCTYKDKIIFLTGISDSVFEYDIPNRKIRSIAANPFQGFVDYYDNMASGKFINYFYVFGGFPYLQNNKFYRFNLDSYTWEDVGMPSVLKQKIQFGASFGNQFILFGDSVTTHQYSFYDSKWYVDTARVPIFPRDLFGQSELGQWSFFAEDSCLYGTDIYDRKIWKITK